MATSSITSATNHTPDGLRPVQLRRDLAKIADLLEIAFGDTIDQAGMSVVREMRALSHLGPLIWVVARLDRAIRAMNHGYVWIDAQTQQLVGNVSIYDAGLARTMVIANVAVHPEFRRRGIAFEMMQAALEAARRHKAKEVWLQVDADNIGAQKLYEKLGFRAHGVFTRWQWYPSYHVDVPERRTSAPDVKRRTGAEWQAHYQLAQAARIDHAGGVGWLRPLHPTTFKRSFSDFMWTLAGVENQEHWVIHHPDDSSMLIAALSMRTVFGAKNRQTELLVHPEAPAETTRDILGFALRQVAELRRGITLDHPDNELTVNTILQRLQFTPKRHWLHMRWCPETCP